MSLRSDHKALMFIGVVAVLGAGVRVVRAAGNETAPSVQPALEHQARVADSAAAAQRGGRSGRGGKGGRGNARKASTRGRADSSGRGSNDAAQSAKKQPVGALDRPGYVNGKLDLDVATAAQIDALPGVTTLMATRIAGDRVRRGPFLNAAGLRRVSGVGNNFLKAIDTLVTYSGTYTIASPGDTVIASRKKRK